MKKFNERFYGSGRPVQTEPVMYKTQQENGVYTCQTNRDSSGSDSKHQPQGPKWTQILSTIVIVVSLLSIAGLSLANYHLQNRLDQVISAEENQQPTEPADTTNTTDLYEASVRKEAGRKSLTIPEIAKIGKPSVVAISTEKAVPFGFYFETLMPVSGSGFFISEDGLIATNNHVVEKSTNIKVHTDNGDLYEAEIVGTDPASDLAVIRIKPHAHETFPAVTFGDSDALEEGELAVAIGNPAGTLEGSITAGIISAKERTIQVDDLELNVLQTDAAINAGNSGGALFNSFGEVIGINTAKLSGNGSATFDGIAFAIPSNFAKGILQDLSEHGEVKNRVMLGIMGRGFDSDFARLYRLADRPGILVSEVLENSSADAAGLVAGDFIVEMDGRATDSISTVNNLKMNWQVGDSIEVIYFRNGQKQSTEMTLQGPVEEAEEEETEATEENPSF